MDLPLAPFIGMRDDIAPSRLAPGWYRRAENIISLSGSPNSPWQIRPGTPLLYPTPFAQFPCQGIFAWKDSAGTIRVLYAGSSSLYVGTAPATAIVVYGFWGGTWTWDATSRFQFAHVNGQLYIVNGAGAGIASTPPSAPATPTGGVYGTGSLVGTYGYKATYYDPLTGGESAASAALSIYCGTKDVMVNAVASADPAYTKVRWYRTKANGSVYYLLGEAYPGNFYDNISDAHLTQELATPGVSLIGTNWRYNGTAIYPMGCKAPTAAPVPTQGAAGLVEVGTHLYVYTYYDPTLDRESDPSPVGTVTITVSASHVSIAAISACADTTFTQIKVYRTQANGEKYFRIPALDGVAPGALDDNTADAGLDDLTEVGDAGENKDTIGQAASCIATTEDGRVVLANFGPGMRREVWPSYSVDYPESFPESTKRHAGAENGANILCMVPRGSHLVLILEDSLWELDPTCTECVQREDSPGGVGCAASTPYGVFYPSYNGIWWYDGNQTRCVSQLIDGTWASVQKSRLPYATAAYDAMMDHVLFGVTLTPGGTQNDTILALDCRTFGSEAGLRWIRWPLVAEALCPLRERQTTWGKSVLLAQGNGYVGRFDDADSWRADGAGVAIPILLDSGDISHLNRDLVPDIEYLKQFRQMFVELEQVP